jgi:hypothetical protein
VLAPLAESRSVARVSGLSDTEREMPAEFEPTTDQRALVQNAATAPSRRRLHEKHRHHSDVFGGAALGIILAYPLSVYFLAFGEARL